MKEKVFNTVIVVVSSLVLLEALWALLRALQRHRPLEAIFSISTVIGTAIVLLTAGVLALRAARFPDLRILIAAVVVCSLGVFFT